MLGAIEKQVSLEPTTQSTVASVADLPHQCSPSPILRCSNGPADEPADSEDTLGQLLREVKEKASILGERHFEAASDILLANTEDTVDTFQGRSIRAC